MSKIFRFDTSLRQKYESATCLGFLLCTILGPITTIGRCSLKPLNKIPDACSSKLLVNILSMRVAEFWVILVGLSMMGRNEWEVGIQNIYTLVC